MTAHFKLQYPEQRTTLSFINLTDKNNSNNAAALTKRSRCKCREVGGGSWKKTWWSMWFLVYWLPLGVVAVHAAVVGLSAGLSAHVPVQLHGHASLRAPLDRCALLLLTLPFWIRKTDGRQKEVFWPAIKRWPRNAKECWFILEVTDAWWTRQVLSTGWLKTKVGTDNTLFLIQKAKISYGDAGWESWG